MVCWLKFLKFVNDAIKDIEPNLPKRKMLSIEILKRIEKEEGHSIEKIEKRIMKEGEEGIKRIAKIISEKYGEQKKIEIGKERKRKKKKEVIEELQ